MDAQGCDSMNIIVDIGDAKWTNNPDDVLVTYSLGSCIGVTAFDPVAGIGGMIHCMLPLSKIAPEKAQQNPMMFVDTGVTAMLQAVFNLGAQRKSLVIKVAGGSLLLDEKKLFMIGERNYTVLRKVLWKNNLMIAAEDVGGNISRTLSLYVNTGRTTIRSGGKETEL